MTGPCFVSLILQPQPWMLSWWRCGEERKQRCRHFSQTLQCPIYCHPVGQSKSHISMGSPLDRMGSPVNGKGGWGPGATTQLVPRTDHCALGPGRVCPSSWQGPGPVLGPGHSSHLLQSRVTLRSGLLPWRSLCAHPRPRGAPGLHPPTYLDPLPLALPQCRTADNVLMSHPWPEAQWGWRPCPWGNFPGGPVVKESACQCKGHWFDPWSRKIPHTTGH